MADVLSRLKRLGLYNPQSPEPEGKELGHTILEELPPVQISQLQANVKPIEPKDCQFKEIVKQQQSDDLCKQVKENINHQRYYEYKVDHDILYRKTKAKNQLFDTVVFPSKLKYWILHAAHENLGHMGINKTYAFYTKDNFGQA